MFLRKILNPVLGALASLALLALGCGGGGGTTTPPPPPPAPVISAFTATPSTVVVHQPATLAWTVTSQAQGTLKLSLAPAIGQISSFATSLTVYPAATTTYTLTAEDSNGTTTRSVTVTTSGFSVALPVNDLLYDSVRDRIVASIPSTGGAQGNTLTLINPATGALDQSIFVGSEPKRLALSDDSGTLYVGLDGAAAVRKFDMASRTPGIQFIVGNDGFFGPMYAETLAVLPGQPGTVAVSRRYQNSSPRHAGVSVYDNGVPRPTSTPGHTGSNVIVSGEASDLLYGYNNETTEFGARQMTVSASGVATTLTKGSATDGFGVDMVFSAGRLYFTNGDVLLASDFSKIGTYSGTGFASAVCVDVPGNTVYFAQGSGRVLAYALNTFVPTGSLTFPSSFAFSRMIKCGNTLALVSPGKLTLLPANAVH